MEDYLCSRKLWVVLNAQTSFWEKVLVGVTQVSVLGPFDDILEWIKLVCKMFAHDKLLFSIFKKDKISQNNLNSDLKENSEKDHQWKMLFNLDHRSSGWFFTTWA